MTGARASARAPFLCEVRPRVCGCRQPAKDLGARQTLERAETVIGGYWNVYLAFFGDQMIWLDWTVTDVRDGRLWWHNGHRVKEERSGKSGRTA